MGFNFQTGHPHDVLRNGDEVCRLLKSTFGDDIPLGMPGERFMFHADELAWSWWGELQDFALRELGESGSLQIRGVDAWEGVYLDADIDRELLKLPRQEPKAEPILRLIAHTTPDSFITRVRRIFGLAPKAGSEDAQRDQLIAMATEMVKQMGPREGERGTLQVGNLRKLIEELESLLAKLNVEATEAAVEALRRSYADEDERVDADGHIQCLCHAWLTATYAREHRAPLWLIK
jgi:hypothetical protein